jgi:GH43 family beta-xylosidase
VNMTNPEPSTILLARIDPSIRYLVDYYWQVAKVTEKHVGIRMPHTPEGIKIADRVVVYKRPA